MSESRLGYASLPLAIIGLLASQSLGFSATPFNAASTTPTPVFRVGLGGGTLAPTTFVIRSDGSVLRNGRSAGAISPPVPVIQGFRILARADKFYSLPRYMSCGGIPDAADQWVTVFACGREPSKTVRLTHAPGKGTCMEKRFGRVFWNYIPAGEGRIIQPVVGPDLRSYHTL